MDKVNAMREKRSSVAVKLIRMIKTYSSQTDVLTCVFEGEDAKYYGVRIDSYLNGMIRKNIQCKGKTNLTTLKKKVDSHSELSSANVLYFADRDFDFEDSTSDRIYITPCYSVENLFIKTEALKTIIIDEFGFCEIDDKEDIEKLISKYEDLLPKVADSLLILNSWIMCQNTKQKVNNSIKLNLNNFDISEFIDFGFDYVVTKYDIDSLSRTFPDSVRLSKDELETAKKIIESFGIVNASRGKYLLDFFRMFLEMIKVEIRDKNSELVKKNAKPKLQLSKTNILSDLSQYATTPQCLVHFLRQNLTEAKAA